MNLIQKLESRVKQTLQKEKIPKSKKILVALSGGKDSATVAYVLNKLGYKIEGFHIDLKIGDYSNRCRNTVEKLCSDLGIKLHIYDMKKEMGSGMCFLRGAIQEKNNPGLKNCAICGVIKKWIFNKKARELKVDFIATGHNLDDEVQTFLMNILKGSPELSSNIGVETKNTKDKKFIPRIKPLFYVAENDVREYTKKLKLPVVYDKCPCALDSYRIQIRRFLEKRNNKEKLNIIKNFERVYPLIEKKKSGEIVYCENCGEPSRNKICKKCELVGMR